MFVCVFWRTDVQFGAPQFEKIANNHPAAHRCSARPFGLICRRLENSIAYRVTISRSHLNARGKPSTMVSARRACRDGQQNRISEAQNRSSAPCFHTTTVRNECPPSAGATHDLQNQRPANSTASTNYLAKSDKCYTHRVNRDIFHNSNFPCRP